MTMFANLSSILGFLLVCSVAINIGQADKYQNRSFQTHAKYVDKNGIEFRVRKIGGRSPTEDELKYLKQCLDEDKNLGILFQSVIVTLKVGSNFYLEQKPSAITGYVTHSCQWVLGKNKK